MTIIIGSDHAGFHLKEYLIKSLNQDNIMINNVGTFNTNNIDCIDIATKLSSIVQSDIKHKGIMLCGSGIASSIICNKFTNIRAGICHDTYSAHQGVEHNNINILIIGAKVIGAYLAKEIMFTFLKAQFINNNKYNNRLNKLNLLEKQKI